ncbi:OmpA family protein [uncultured Brachyspira sp.]|uniref:OmpA family protein n=1 Tax=uncultured Brachyspira sp. TaxID=221953 RepID=UPI0025E2B522|nr:OmpA family protein [uncultured Brachyspira sp.]
MKNKIFTLTFLSIIIIYAASCSTNDKHVIVLALSKQLHAVLYNDNSESTKTASKTYTQKNDIATVYNSVEESAQIEKKEEVKITANNENDAEKYNKKEEPNITSAEIMDSVDAIDVVDVVDAAIIKETKIAKQNYDNEVFITKNIISFDFDSYELKEEYNKGIDEIYEYLNKNKNVNLIIEGHSDSRGNYNYNIYLSENRAKAIFNRLVDKGIHKERLRYIGYGSKYSSEYNDKDRKCQFVIINNSNEEAKYKKDNETDIIKLKN